MASYHGRTETSSEVIFKHLDAGRDLLILDDILESGHTLATVRKRLERAKRAQHSGLCAAEQK